MTMKYPTPEADLSSVKRYSIKDRPSKVSSSSFATTPDNSCCVGSFLDRLPDILAAASLKKLVAHLHRAKEQGSPIYWLMGGHVIKVGLAPVLIELAEKGYVQGVMMNSAASIHDSEIARFGQTSEDVATAIRDGSFGMAEETSVEYLQALKSGIKRGLGWGESIAEWLNSEDIANPSLSLLANCHRMQIPVVIHGALGTDIIWQHPELDGEVIGKGGERDFRKTVTLLQALEGGVVLNWGSAVILPEVFLKSFTLARNLGAELKKVTCANFDMIQHYRPHHNILKRPTEPDGEQFAITGHHEIMMPLLAHILLAK